MWIGQTLLLQNGVDVGKGTFVAVSGVGAGGRECVLSMGIAVERVHDASVDGSDESLLTRVHLTTHPLTHSVKIVRLFSTANHAQTRPLTNTHTLAGAVPVVAELFAAPPRASAAAAAGCAWQGAAGRVGGSVRWRGQGERTQRPRAVWMESCMRM